MKGTMHLILLLAVPAVLCFIVAMGQPRLLNYTYIGCYVDGGNSNRDLTGLTGLATLGPYINRIELAYFYNSHTVTIELCSSLCAMGRFRYFSLQATAFCFCGSTYGKHGAAPESECNKNCVGNASQVCGANDRNSIYESVYAPETGLLKRTASSASVLTTASGAPTDAVYWTLPAAVPFECIAACRRSPQCLACAFVASSRICGLMKFAAVPSDTASEAQWVWVKQF